MLEHSSSAVGVVLLGLVSVRATTNDALISGINAFLPLDTGFFSLNGSVGRIVPTSLYHPKVYTCSTRQPFDISGNSYGAEFARSAAPIQTWGCAVMAVWCCSALLSSACGLPHYGSSPPRSPDRDL